jgi:Proliferating cell nuclear antigen, C-terminal domain
MVGRGFLLPDLLLIFSHSRPCRCRQSELFRWACGCPVPATINSLRGCTITMPSTTFRALMEDLRNVQADLSCGPGYHLSVSCTVSEVNFTIKGSIGSGTIPVVTNAANNIYVVLCEPFEASWPMREINTLTRVPFECERIVITCSRDERFKHFSVKYAINYRHFDGEVGYIRYAIRPQ